MDKKNEESVLRHEILKNVLIVATICLLGSCTDEYKQEFLLEIPSYKYVTTIKGVEIEVSPKALKVGEKVRIDIEHEDGDTVEVIISSLSLAYNDTVTTPYLTKITMDSVGLYGISFEVDGQKPESPAIIKVTK